MAKYGKTAYLFNFGEFCLLLLVLFAHFSNFQAKGHRTAQNMYKKIG
jgi:hypothetical protein